MTKMKKSKYKIDRLLAGYIKAHFQKTLFFVVSRKCYLLYQNK